MLIAASLAATLAMQGLVEIPQAVVPDNPETWVTEYPRVIQPLVHDYRRCLNYADRRFRGLADFEQQHSEDLPRCAKLKEMLIEKSEEALREGRWSEYLAPERAHEVFDTVGYIHIARGRDFDNQLNFMRAQQERRIVNTDFAPEAEATRQELSNAENN